MLEQPYAMKFIVEQDVSVGIPNTEGSLILHTALFLILNS